MPTMEDLRLEARLTIAELSRKAGLDIKTVRRAVRGEPVQKLKAVTILDTLSKELGRPIQLEDVEGLNLASYTT